MLEQYITTMKITLVPNVGFYFGFVIERWAIFTGNIPGTFRPAVYQMLDVFALTCIHDIFALKERKNNGFIFLSEEL